MANQRRGDPIDKLLPLFIDDDEDYWNQYQKLRRRRRKLPEEINAEADEFLKHLEKALKW